MCVCVTVALDLIILGEELCCYECYQISSEKCASDYVGFQGGGLWCPKSSKE